MDDQSTFPSVLTPETVPVPLAMQKPAQGEPNQASGRGWFGLALKAVAVLLVLWFIAHGW